MKATTGAGKKSVLVLAIAGVTAFAGSYTLETLVDAGMKNSKQVKIVGEEIKKVDAQIFEAYGSALPSIDFSANYQHAFETFSPIEMTGLTFDSTQALLMQTPLSVDTSTYQPLPQDHYGDPDVMQIAQTTDLLKQILGSFSSLDFDGKPNTLALTLSLSQPLYAQGKVGIGLKIAKIYKEGLDSKYKFVQDTVRASITKLFYAALLAQKNALVQEEAVKLAQESHRLTVVRFAVGKSSEIDTLVSRLAYEKAAIDRRTMESQLRVAYDALIKQCGVPESPSAFSLEGEFPKGEYSIGFEEAKEKMRDRNLVLKQLESGAQVQQQLVRLAKSDFMPMVYCGASLGKIYQFEEFGEIDWGNKGADDQKIFVGATINLFNGFKKIQKVKQAQTDRYSFELTQKMAQDGLEIGLLAVHERLETARAQLESSQALLNLAGKGYTMSKVAYEIGTVTLNDFQKRELEYEGAKIALNAALFAFHSAVVEIKIMTGEF
jgi:outer membrane protein TolC